WSSSSGGPGNPACQRQQRRSLKKTLRQRSQIGRKTTSCCGSQLRKREEKSVSDKPSRIGSEAIPLSKLELNTRIMFVTEALLVCNEDLKRAEKGRWPKGHARKQRIVHAPPQFFKRVVVRNNTIGLMAQRRGLVIHGTSSLAILGSDSESCQ